MIINGTPPKDITGNLKQALDAANWITLSDAAAVALAERLALALDVALDTGELKDVPQLSQRFLAVLQQLHLTPETRTQGKRDDEADGNGHRENYLRLLATPINESKTGTSKRGASSK